ncbi:leucine-rich repeat domain-containing protein [Thalassomonas haliotis]|uniref:Leucine-rich repeat domain-containing protein n=1 Tax=Thalassomonas haliotis TaxID=485448 RepID=A0ABY7V8S2_9GAMM|nr:leucine-rich repeat domain-containing protein [Thalassomonas haliotis]WDE09973.1 leucine-rich repeat domain-containing protein [Thalassomonas haliotis]
MALTFNQSPEWIALVNLLLQGLEDNSNRPVLWVGAGLSAAAGYPPTDTLIKQLSDKSLKPLLPFAPTDENYALDSPQRSFTHWIAHFIQANNYNQLNKILSKVFLEQQKAPTAMHQQLVQLPWQVIITTNYDELLESAFKQTAHPFTPITLEQNLALAHAGRISLFKIHGSIYDIEKWIFDEDSYLDYAQKYPLLDSKLKTLLLSQPIVFIGCSMTDPRIINWYLWCKKQNKLAQLPYAIAIIKKENWQQLPGDITKLYQQAGVNPLFFKEFDELPLLIEALGAGMQAPEAAPKTQQQDAGEHQIRQARLIEDILYDELTPSIIQAIANVWLQVPEGSNYLEHLKNNHGARVKNIANATFATLQSDFAELSLRLTGKQTPFASQKMVLSALASQLRVCNPTFDTVNKVDFKPQQLNGALKFQHTPNELAKADKDQQGLFDKLLPLLCELIVDCSEALPAWNKDNLLAQLQEPRELFEKLNEELRRWQEIKEVNRDEKTEIEELYRRAVARRFDELRIFGINFGGRSRKYQLRVAYISLNTETEYNDELDSEILSTEQALTGFERLVIIGDAGQGKTTLLQWLTVQCGRQDFSGDKAPWNQKVPVIIKLRQVLHRKQLPGKSDFYALMVEDCQVEQSHQNWLDAVLDDKRAIIMIDGFDEVPENRRLEVMNWIKTLCREYAGNQFMLTSRPSAYQDNTLKALNFQAVKLQSMDQGAQQSFIEHWHQAVALEYDKTKPDAYAGEGENLLQQLKLQRPLRTLAQNPLLCGVLCMLHHDRSGYLPKNRTDLYQATSRMFLDSRDREKKIIEDERFVLLDHQDKVILLAYVAHWMTQKKLISLTPDNLLARLAEKLNNLPKLNKQLSAEDLKSFFLERSGLLQAVGAGEIQFAHRSFQEFFTAEYLMVKRDWATLRKNASKDYWHGTIQLAIGLCQSREDNEKYLSKLLEKAEKFDSQHNENQAISLYLLVLSCKEGLREISPEFADKLDGIIPKIIPPPSAKVRDALSNAGELAIPHLKRPQQRSIQKDHYCAYALIQIATAEAYVLLLDYFKDNRESYREKITRDIEKMDGDIAKEAQLAKLMIKQGLDKFPQPLCRKMAFLCQSPPLLAAYAEEEDPNLSDWELSQGLAPLVIFKNLYTLDLGHAYIEDFSPLAKLTALEELNASYSETEDLAPLSHLRELHTLELEGANIQDLLPLANLTELQILNLHYTEVKDLTPLAKLSNLRELYLEETEVEKLTGLKKLTALQILELSYNEIDDLSPLAKLNRLERLQLAATNVRDLTPLEKLSRLRFLDLDETLVEDLTPLAKLSQLQTLYLSNTAIKDLTPLKNLKSLKELYVRDCNLSDINELKKTLPGCRIYT